MRGNLDRINCRPAAAARRRLDRGEQRRSVMVALAQNNCGPQYRTAARAPGGFFDQLFGRDANEPPPAISPIRCAGRQRAHRSACAPATGSISRSPTRPTRRAFREDEKTCQRMCLRRKSCCSPIRRRAPTSRRRPRINGQPYTALPNALKYRSEFNPSCSCKRPGQSWADALGKDEAVEPGDVVVTEERAKQMALPPPAQKGTDEGQAARPARSACSPPRQPAEPAPAVPESEPGKRTVRSVGPTFIPPRTQ
jgi:hypothetical protein